MKKRLVAVILSLFMCTSMVSEAGAAAFTSPDAAVSDVETDTESIVTENTEESTDDVEAGDETEDLVSDFSSGAEEDNISDAADSKCQDNAQATAFHPEQMTAQQFLMQRRRLLLYSRYQWSVRMAQSL